MATRRETNLQKERLKEALRTSCHNGTMRPGEPAPSLRHLAEEWKLSKNVISQSLQELIDEGLLHTVPRRGTFIGQPRQATNDDYMVLMQQVDDPIVRQRNASICAGFEERIAQLGGSTLCLTRARARATHAQGDLPPIAGVLEMEWEDEDPPFWASNPQPVYRVRFRSSVTTQHFDTVSFDDIDGGRKAAGHLLQRGHRQIAFVGLHRLDGREPLWSRERETGWEQALAGAGLASEKMAFHALHNMSLSGKSEEGELCEEDVAGEAAAALAAHFAARSSPVITAVVAANDTVARSVLQALEAARVPKDLWPSIVGFDNVTEASPHLMSSLRLPWNDLGRAAAEVLWKRKHGELQGPPHDERVPMKLISRLTCRRDWSHQMSHAALATATQ